MAVTAQESADEFDRRIEGIAGSDLRLDFGTVVLGAVFRAVTEMGGLVIGEKRFTIVRDAVYHGMADALGYQATLDQLHQVVE